jgi:predicted RNase H-like HicB family nuclease
MMSYRFAAVIEKDEDGYFAFCPELQGCYTSGDTYEEARANLLDAVHLYIENRLAAGEKIKPNDADFSCIMYPPYS